MLSRILQVKSPPTHSLRKSRDPPAAYFFACLFLLPELEQCPRPLPCFPRAEKFLCMFLGGAHI